MNSFSTFDKNNIKQEKPKSVISNNQNNTQTNLKDNDSSPSFHNFDKKNSATKNLNIATNKNEQGSNNQVNNDLKQNETISSIISLTNNNQVINLETTDFNITEDDTSKLKIDSHSKRTHTQSQRLAESTTPIDNTKSKISNLSNEDDQIKDIEDRIVSKDRSSNRLPSNSFGFDNIEEEMKMIEQRISDNIKNFTDNDNNNLQESKITIVSESNFTVKRQASSYLQKKISDFIEKEGGMDNLIVQNTTDIYSKT